MGFKVYGICTQRQLYVFPRVRKTYNCMRVQIPCTLETHGTDDLILGSGKTRKGGYGNRNGNAWKRNEKPNFRDPQAFLTNLPTSSICPIVSCPGSCREGGPPQEASLYLPRRTCCETQFTIIVAALLVFYAAWA